MFKIHVHSVSLRIPAAPDLVIAKPQEKAASTKEDAEKETQEVTIEPEKETQEPEKEVTLEPEKETQEVTLEPEKETQEPEKEVTLEPEKETQEVTLEPEKETQEEVTLEPEKETQEVTLEPEKEKTHTGGHRMSTETTTSTNKRVPFMVLGMFKIHVHSVSLRIPAAPDLVIAKPQEKAASTKEDAEKETQEVSLEPEKETQEDFDSLRRELHAIMHDLQELSRLQEEKLVFMEAALMNPDSLRGDITKDEIMVNITINYSNNSEFKIGLVLHKLYR
ncbi:myb-like protein X [Penaeus vannamei]|uniref:myb-like protein X n=1 Tax=Penaeus vannamei TaxID=6689 RepID=UPI00387F9D02